MTEACNDLAPSEECRGVMAERLANLRNVMAEYGLAAYIIPSGDDHQSEYTCSADKRIAYISGFTGSAGTAVVTQNSAALWADSRYYLQAQEQISKDWKLMRFGETATPTVNKWLAEVLKPGDKISADPRKINKGLWKTYSEIADIEMTLVKDNLIDKVWTDRPPYPNGTLFVHDVKYSGASWVDKLEKVREAVKVLKGEALVVTALDEIAWLYNLRGSDIKYMPVFRAYSIVCLHSATLYLPKEKIQPLVQQHLTSDDHKVELKEYDSFWTDLEELGKNFSGKIVVPSTATYTQGSSYLAHSLVPEEKLIGEPSPVISLRAYKTEVEAEGSRRAHVRDAVALCQLMHFLENTIVDGCREWDELKVSQLLTELRSEQELNKGESFETIVAFGKNGALPHYKPEPATNLVVDASAPLTIDSGGQYLDGTIDTTRVFHYGVPTAEEKEVYTGLLRGVSDMAMTVFPEGSTLQQLEFIIRRPLLMQGRDYGHGSTHGTGVYLGVHESFNATYAKNFIGSQEPGFYKSEEYGMRLENLVIVVPASVERHTTKELFTFEPLTLVPYEAKLINTTLLERCHIEWLNSYHAKVLEKVGAEMEAQGRQELLSWLQEKTKPLALAS